MRANLRLWIIVVISIGVGFFAQLIIPEPFDWSETYGTESKEPFGTYVFAQEAYASATLDVSYGNIPLSDQMQIDSAVNIIIISPHLPFDTSDFNLMLEYVSKGHDVAIFAHAYPTHILDRMGLDERLRMVSFVEALKISERMIIDEDTLTLMKSELVHASFNIDEDPESSLRGIWWDAQQQPLLVQAEIGKGKLFLAQTPEIFANYNLLNHDSYEWINKLMQMFQDKSFVIYDRENIFRQTSGTIMEMVWSHPSITTAYYVFLFLIFILLLPGSRRSQPFIPFYSLPENQNLNFARAVAGLYEIEKVDHVILSHRWKNLENHIQVKYHGRYSLNPEGIKEHLSDIYQLEENEISLLIDFTKLSSFHHLKNEAFIGINQTIDKILYGNKYK